MKPDRATQSRFARAEDWAPPGNGRLRLSIFVHLPGLLRELGQDPRELVASAGLDLGLFDDPEHLVSFVTMSHLLSVCADRTGCRHLGLLLGQRGGASDLGLVGQLAQNSPDVGSALHNLILHLHLHDRGGVPTLAVTDGVATLGYAVYQKGVVSAGNVYDAAIAVSFNIMRALCGPKWLPTEVLFSHARPVDIQPYRRFFRTRLRFDAWETALVFPAKWLQHPLPGADHQLRRILEATIEAIEANGDGDVVSQVRRVLRSLVLTGRGSVQQVADAFSLHRRTLNRRLRAQSTTLNALADEMRFELARQLLEDTGLTIIEIATALDYADRSAFTRAFRRWSGTTPAEWRVGPADSRPDPVSPRAG
jgi:AraC-like DNA-binding protein